MLHEQTHNSTLYPNTPPLTQQLTVVEVLKGFAILFMPVHNIKHFDFWYFPEYLPV